MDTDRFLTPLVTPLSDDELAAAAAGEAGADAFAFFGSEGNAAPEVKFVPGAPDRFDHVEFMLLSVGVETGDDDLVDVFDDDPKLG